MPSLPTGTVPFLFTDIEGSTELLQSLGDRRYAEVLENIGVYSVGPLLKGTGYDDFFPWGSGRQTAFHRGPTGGIRTPGGYQGWCSFISIPHKPQVLNPHGAG